MVLGIRTDQIINGRTQQCSLYGNCRLSLQGCKCLRLCIVAVLKERMGKDLKNIMISRELFILLMRYFLLEENEPYNEIRKGLEQKLDSLVMRELYGKYKTAPTEEEREKARQEYLDRRGVPESFRW